MPDLRMKQVRIISIVAGLSFLAFSVLIPIGCKPSPAQLHQGPPVIVVGGSIFGQTPGPWLPNSSCGVSDPLEWCYGLSSGAQDHLYSDQYSPAISNPGIPSGKSWTVHITDKDPQGNGNPKQGILLCGNSACDENAASDANNVYIKPFSKGQGNAGWINSPANYLFYQDKTCSPNGNCEHPDTAILSVGGQQVSSSQCTAPSAIGCSIAVGAASVKRPQ